MNYVKPKIRSLQTHFGTHRGRSVIILHDPLGLSSNVVAIPHELGPLLALCDGTRTPEELRAALLVRAGINLPTQHLQHFLEQLDEGLMLDNDRYAAAKAALLEKYRSASHREPSSAGTSYPRHTAELQTLLDSFMEKVADERHISAEQLAGARGVICPHIDYARGGEIYASTWKAIAQAAQAAELVIILGTDHMGSDGRITLTKQNYATPWGVFPTDQSIVDALAQAVGEESAFGEELHHIAEHSIELALVWLHYIRRGKPCKLIPILCGGFHSFVSGDTGPADDATYARVKEVLAETLGQPGTLVIAAADLAHVGPAFGDMLPFDYLAKMRLQNADERLIDTIVQGDADKFFQEIKAVGDRHNVCGLPPIYLTLRLLEPSSGHRLGYQQCPADEDGTSWVTICGIALT